MAENVVVDMGPARSDKTYQLLERYRAEIEKGLSGHARAIWIAPTSRAAAEVREQLAAGGVRACLAPGVTTFDELTTRILADCAGPLSPISAAAQREMLRRLIRDAMNENELSSFAATAGSTGFVDLVVEHIRELKRRGIEPEAFAKAPSRRPSALEQKQLGRLYAEYQRRLTEHALADREGVHWLARGFLAEGRCEWLHDLALIVVDGFTDFNPTQHETLRLLAARSQAMHITLPADTENAADARPDLFAKTKATLAELRRQHPPLRIARHEPRPYSWTPLGHMAEQVFRDPRTAVSLPQGSTKSLDKLEIVAAVGQHGEIVEIARRIKRQLAERGAKPGEILVVFRSLQPVAARVREVFGEFGIPFALESSERLVLSPLIKTVLQLLRLAAEDWPFRRVVAVVTNNMLAALDDNSRAAANWLVRDLQIASGRAALLERVEQLAAASEGGQLLSEQQDRRANAARVALPAFRRLAGAFDKLPEKGTIAEWSHALSVFVAELGAAFPRAADSVSADPTSASAEKNAWQALSRHLASLHRLDAQFGQPPRTITLREMLQEILDVVTHEPLPASREESGRVRVLSAASARTVCAKHLYLAGMAEQRFPAPEPAGRLFTDDDYRFFQRVAHQREAERGSDPSSNLPVANRSQDEMLLFYEVLTRAEESLTISYPALDEKAQTLPPSPYVGELERMLGPEHFAARRIALQPSPLPRVERGDPPLSPTDFRLRAAGDAVDSNNKDRSLLAGVFWDRTGLAPAAALEAGLRIVDVRGKRDAFGPGDGLLQGAAAGERLARRFGPQHYWSPSQWEQYAACPYKFFLSDVLSLEPLGDLTLEVDFGRRGGLLHHVLAEFHRTRQSLPADKDAADYEKKFVDHLLAVLEATVGASPRVGVDWALVELDRRQIAKWAVKHREHLDEYNLATACDTLTPAHFELRFGPARASAEGDDPGSNDDHFEYDIGTEKVRVTGRIDRVDVGSIGGKQVFSIVDYKTGKAPSLKEEQIISGERLQLPIYVAAAQAMFFDKEAEPVAAGYWTMDRGFDSKGALNVLQKLDDSDSKEKWEELQEQVKERVSQFVHNIRRGEFPVHSRDEHCTGKCEFSTVCRIAQVRSLKKDLLGDALNPPPF